MPAPSLCISSTANPRIKLIRKLSRRSHRDEAGFMLVEGYRELKCALTNGYALAELFICPDLYLGENEPALLEQALTAGARLIECSETVFRKISYRDRPDGLLGLGPQLRYALDDLKPAVDGLYLVAEAIEKPGNLGTILRSADAAGVAAVLVCDRCTDIGNPNVVRASVGTIFTRPVVETSSAQAIAWLKGHGIRLAAAMPDAGQRHTEADFTGPTAIVVGTEKFGLSPAWAAAADCLVTIPMYGQADSLNVASATTILLYEALRQRGQA